jgi:endonuclease/exonuclease/phosphatase family metal-dependent hydrolase
MNEATSHYFENSLMSRYVLMAELDKPNIIIATAHFESEFKDCKKKHSQYSECKKLLEKKHEKKKLPVVLTCDSNCGFKDEIYFFKGWKDCWKDKGNKDNKFTYDGKTNPNINHNYRNRLDRIIYKGKNMSVKSFDMHKNVKGMHIPSDHYGVIADLFC